MNPALMAWWGDPVLMFEDRGMTCDPWQARVLRSHANRLLLLAARQSGKSTVTATLALRRALLYENSLVLLFAPSLRQSGELFRKVMLAYRELGRPVAAEKELSLSLDLVNGSRIVTLPGDEDTTRGYSAPALVILDEAARCNDDLIAAISPMLATVPDGRLLLLSTPVGRRGVFFDLWTNNDPTWERIIAPASDCPRIDPAFLAQERLILGERWYNQEYMCRFEETIGQLFSSEEIDRAFSRGGEPFKLEGFKHVFE